MMTAVDLKQTVQVDKDLQIRAYYAGHVRFLNFIPQVCTMFRAAFELIDGICSCCILWFQVVPLLIYS
ncbi:unnamed protein product [Ilex paraguariensis]|uniref:Uncharacterized protein n=1 Tax=Ilex paraguariensis TaxID=185542 RepID=A0ABC8QY24_9AQUA